jgi:hypothetical protein
VDVSGASGDTILYNQGSGATFAASVYTTEANDVKNPPLSRHWYVHDRDTARGVWIFVGPNDGTADVFSNKDVGLRLYKQLEDEEWPFGATGRLGYLNPSESIEAQDVVFWYVAHLRHVAADGAHLASDGTVTSPQMGPVLRVQLEGSTLSNLNSGRCADVADRSTADQANVQQYTCHGGGNQRWDIRAYGGALQIINLNSGKCVVCQESCRVDRIPVAETRRCDLFATC